MIAFGWNGTVQDERLLTVGTSPTCIINVLYHPNAYTILMYVSLLLDKYEHYIISKSD